MDIVCLICNKETVKNLAEVDKFCKHVSKCTLRSDNPLQERYQCSICRTVVKQNRSFKDHIIKKHLNGSGSATVSSQSTSTKKHIFVIEESRGPDIQRDVYFANTEDDIVIATGTSQDKDVTADSSKKLVLVDFEERLLSISAEIFGQMNLSMDVAEGFMKHITQVVELTSDVCKARTDESAAAYGQEVQHHFQQMSNITNGRLKRLANKFNTEQKLKTALSKKNALFLPRTKIFAEKEEQVGDDLVTIKYKATILPIESQIKQLLEKNDLLKIILDNQASLECQPSITSFLTGQRWKNIKETFSGKPVIPVFLFNDDYGPDDGLSPHTSSNKISGYYYSFPTLPVEMSSSIDSIFVAMLAKTCDIKLVGPNALLRLLVEEFKPLEDRGIMIGGEKIFITPVIMCGDNLGINYNLGVHGFRGSYFCRMCFMARSRTEVCCEEDESLLRTEEHYQACLNAIENNNESYGILFRTYLNNLKSFNFSHSLVADIMHDLMSGVCVYGVLELLKRAVSTKKFTLKQFNEVKNRFDYGSKDKHYKVGDITKNHINKGSIRAHAREIWTLVKYLPAMLGKLLPANSPLRKYACILNNFLHLCLKGSFTEEDLEELKSEATKHDKEFLRLFNRNNNTRLLPPKAHIILHYARIITQSGPLKYLWSMRFEAKHQQCKAYAKVCNSRRNLCLSIGKKLCYHNAFVMMKKQNTSKITEMKKTGRRNHVFPNELQNFESCSSLKYKGRLYCVGDFILSNTFNQAFKILDIAVRKSSDEMVLVTGSYAISFRQILRLYKIDDNNHVNELKNVDELHNPPLSSIRFDGHLYIHHDEF